MLALPTFVANAEEDSWFFEATKTKITGRLYRWDGPADEANASTNNNSSNNIKVWVKIYATDNGTTLDGSVRTNTGYPSAWVKSAARKPSWWGSIHTTTPTPDPYRTLNLYVGG